MRYIRNKRALELKPLPDAAMDVRLLLVGERYVSPHFKVSYGDLVSYMWARIGLSHEGLEMPAEMFLKKISWQGELWFEIHSDDWKAFWLECFHEARRMYPGWPEN